MATNTTDFEKYPKYRLDKHGIVINRILTNAESVFGMAANTAADVKLRSNIHGGKFIKEDENNTSAIFANDFNLEHLNDGIVTISSDNELHVELAVASYADADQIKAIFTTIEAENTDIDPEDEPEALAAPEIDFLENGDLNISEEA